MQERFKASLKIDWTLATLIAVLFAVVAYERGFATAAWVTGSVLYMIAILAFSLFGLVAVTTRTRPDKWTWLSALYALAFIGVALSLSFSPLAFISILGLICGLVLGAYVSILARRAGNQ